MILACLVHTAYCVVLLLSMLEGDSQKSLRCTILHMSERVCYLLANMILMLYYFHLYQNGRMQSMDIFIFDLQKRTALYGLLMPLIIAGLHCTTNAYICRHEPFPVHTTAIYCSHLTAESLVLWLYFCWYQAELKRYSGGDTQTDDFSGRNQGLPDNVANQGDTLNN